MGVIEPPLSNNEHPKYIEYEDGKLDTLLILTKYSHKYPMPLTKVMISRNNLLINCVFTGGVS